VGTLFPIFLFDLALSLPGKVLPPRQPLRPASSKRFGAPLMVPSGLSRPKARVVSSLPSFSPLYLPLCPQFVADLSFRFSRARSGRLVSFQMISFPSPFSLPRPLSPSLPASSSLFFPLAPTKCVFFCTRQALAKLPLLDLVGSRLQLPLSLPTSQHIFLPIHFSFVRPLPLPPSLPPFF